MKCWIVTSGMIGMENQCLGITDALGCQPDIKRIGLRQPWAALTPFLGFERAASFSGDPLRPPWPDLAIGCGRKSVAALRYIKRASGGQTFTLFIQDPKTDPRAFDLVAVPEHDALRGPNVIVTQAATNRLTSGNLQRGRDEWSAAFAPLPAPRVAVLIGGKSKTHDLTNENVAALAGHLQRLVASGHSLMITMSRRTGVAREAALRAALSDTNAWIWDNTGANPLFGMLAWADYVIVTSDSVSMISEAATTGKPVYVMQIEGGSTRFDRFYQSLQGKGMIRAFEGALEPYSYQPLNDTERVARAVSGGMAARS